MTSSNALWCWQKSVYVCQDKADSSILLTAKSDYNIGWEYGLIGGGRDLDLDGLKEINCRQLVNYTLEKLNYHKGPEIIKINSQVPFPPDYFCRVHYYEADRGDIIYFRPDPVWLDSLPFVYRFFAENLTHIGIISSTPTTTGIDYYGWFYGAQDQKTGIIDMPWNSNQQFIAWESDKWSFPFKFYVAGIYRPKKLVWHWKCSSPLSPPNKPLGQAPPDPLILDLNGGGIRTVGLGAGIHFDQDANGFKELSGWVAPGDGMLMLDKNGNGRLDEGSELFGNFTILPNGVKADNGFQALAFYDANRDGKIDANDPIWSQLRVWQYDDSVLASSSPETTTPPSGGG